MDTTKLVKLAELIRRDRDAVLARWRQQVRHLPSARHMASGWSAVHSISGLPCAKYAL